MKLFRSVTPDQTALVADEAPIADDQYWNAVADWDRPSLNTAKFAALLGISAAAVRQLRARNAEFPRPEETATQHLWSPRAVYSWIEAERPKRKHVVPRLFHRGIGLRQATFVAAETHSLMGHNGRSTTWVVHLWQPADDRGSVAIAYGDYSTAEAKSHAEQLLSRLTHVSAVAVVTSGWLPMAVDVSQFQPEITVAERPRDAGQDKLHISECGWFRLAALLRVDLPWWPEGLARPAAIAAWRPGAQTQAIRPYAEGFYDESVLRNLLHAAASRRDAEYLAEFVEALNRRIEADIYWCPSGGKADVPGNTERPGLIQAAQPHFRIIDVPTVSRGEATRLLHTRVPNRAIRATARYLLQGRAEIAGLISHTIAVTAESGPFAQQWLSRLEAVDDPETLGSSYAELHLAEDEARLWWRDPRNADCWIVQKLDGTYFATVGTQLTEATGHLVAATLSEDCRSAFFRDSNDVVWPMPVRAFGGYYTCGYDGTGPSELEYAINTLLDDAASDLAADRPRAVPPRPDLHRLIRAERPPLYISNEFDQV